MKKFLKKIGERVIVSWVTSATAVAATWATIYAHTHHWDTWLLITGTAAAALYFISLLLFIHKWWREKVEAQRRAQELKAEHIEMELDLVKGVLSAYVLHLNSMWYNDENMRARSYAEDLPKQLAAIMKQKWYNSKTPAQADAFINQFLGQIGYSTIKPIVHAPLDASQP